MNMTYHPEIMYAVPLVLAAIVSLIFVMKIHYALLELNKLHLT
jgi:hypothetical protein